MGKKYTADGVRYLLGFAEDEAGARREEADDKDASEAGWGDEDRVAADEVEELAQRLTPLAEKIAALLNEECT